jgi:hypothetical protein
MQEHCQHIKQASAEAEDSWTSQHKFFENALELLRDIK